MKKRIGLWVVFLMMFSCYSALAANNEDKNWQERFEELIKEERIDDAVSYALSGGAESGEILEAGIDLGVGAYDMLVALIAAEIDTDILAEDARRLHIPTAVFQRALADSGITPPGASVAISGTTGSDGTEAAGSTSSRVISPSSP